MGNKEQIKESLKNSCGGECDNCECIGFQSREILEDLGIEEEWEQIDSKEECILYQIAEHEITRRINLRRNSLIEYMIKSDNIKMKAIEIVNHVDSLINEMDSDFSIFTLAMLKEMGDGKSCKKTPKKDYIKGWEKLRYEAFRKYGNKCCLCGRTPKDGVILHVDHIKPKSKYPKLKDDIENLQILCNKCNTAKSNRYSDDWR